MFTILTCLCRHTESKDSEKHTDGSHKKQVKRSSSTPAAADVNTQFYYNGTYYPKDDYYYPHYPEDDDDGYYYDDYYGKRFYCLYCLALLLKIPANLLPYPSG